MAYRNYLKIDSLARCTLDLWDGNPLVRIAARKHLTPRWGGIVSFRYFVVRQGDPAGYGSWVDENELAPLSPLELLALEAEDEDK